MMLTKLNRLWESGRVNSLPEMPRTRQVVFVPKCVPGDGSPWLNFGSSRSEYEKWIPHVCGICCLKMIGDSAGLTTQLTLYTLTLMCLAKRGFVQEADGKISGVFHYPLAELAGDLGLAAEVDGNLASGRCISHIRRGSILMLSVNLAKVNPSLSGGHLVVVYDYSPKSDVFMIHDCSSVLRTNGCGISISRRELDGISNRKGLVFTLEMSDARGTEL